MYINLQCIKWQRIEKKEGTLPQSNESKKDHIWSFMPRFNKMAKLEKKIKWRV